MSVRKRVRRANRDAPELNITAFMNLMVVLVPFLLISAVFSQMTILELNLPKDTNQNQKQDQKKVLNFEVIVRSDGLTVADTLGGVIKKITKTNGEHDFKALSELLKQIKSKFPDKQNITILLEPNIEYATLVTTMDTVRVITEFESGSAVKKELFPLIAIGDAP
ncbi:ExbD/TolR family protein [Kaarinaea lacus]